jgi:KDO2-lipid IV(A) lauroyltransferase
MRLLYFIIIRPLSILPAGILYVLSDYILFPFLYHILRYRRELVKGNINRSFPENTADANHVIIKKFYHHLSDLIVESIMLFGLSKEEIIKRGQITNPEILQPYYEQGRSVCLVGGHYNNWEMLTTSIGTQIPHQADGIYTRLQNRWMDRKVNTSRSRFGMRLVHKKTVAEHFEHTANELTATIFAVDQSPRKSQKVYWLDFMEQKTAVAFGAEKYARKYNWPVLYGHIGKVSRGHYTLTLELLSENPNSEIVGKITEMHTRVLEAEIRNNPAYWLWTHNRWKQRG